MLRRAPIGKDDQDALGANAQDYLSNRLPQTNDWSVRYPYEITFKGLTPELKQVLEGLAHSSRGFVVRYVKVEPFNIATQLAAEGMAGGLNPEYMSRYGIGASRYGGGMRGRYGVAPPIEAVAPPPPKPTTGVIVDKQPLKITLMVEAVRSLPAGAKPAPAPDGTAAPAPDGTTPPATPDPAATPAQPQAANQTLFNRWSS
jgi:hypothetical protein